MIPLPDSFDIPVAKSLVKKVRTATLFERPRETYTEGWNLAGYAGTWLPDGKPVFGAASGGATIPTDEEAVAYLESIIIARESEGLQALPASTWIALAKWAMALLLRLPI